MPCGVVCEGRRSVALEDPVGLLSKILVYDSVLSNWQAICIGL